MPPGPSTRASIYWIGGLTLFYFLLAHPHPHGYELENVLAAAQVIEGRLPLLEPGRGAWPGIRADRQWVTRHGPAALLLHLPWLALSRTLGAIGVPDAGYFRGLPIRDLLAIELGQALVVALSAWTLLLVLGRLGVARSTAWWTASLYALGTVVVPYAAFGMEPPLTLGLIGAFYLILRWGQDGGRRNAASVGFVLGLLTLTKAYVFFWLAVLCGYVVAQAHRHLRWREVLWMAARALPGLGVALLYNSFTNGNPLVFARLRSIEFAAGNLINSVYAFAASPSMALWIYSPPLVLAFLGWRQAWRRWRLELMVIALLGLGLLAAVGPTVFWCDADWGPRFTVPLSPLLMIAAVPVVERAQNGLARLALVALAIASTCTQVVGTIFEYNRWYEVLQTAGMHWGEAATYIPELSHLFIHLLLALAFLVHALSGQALVYQFTFRTSPPKWSEVALESSKPVDLHELATPGSWPYWAASDTSVLIAALALLAAAALLTATILAMLHRQNGHAG